MTKLASLQDLFVEELRDLYHAEKQLVKALPKMAEAASHEELRQGFEEHLEQTQNHVARLEQVFELLDDKARSKRCMAMESLIEESQELIEEEPEPAVLDAGLICRAQKVEHYEITGYGTVCTWAEQLGHHEAARLLKQTLAEEKATDEKLTELAESMINQEAAVGNGRQ